MTDNEIAAALARGYTTPDNESKAVDPDLIDAMVIEIVKLRDTSPFMTTEDAEMAVIIVQNMWWENATAGQDDALLTRIVALLRAAAVIGCDHERV